MKAAITDNFTLKGNKPDYDKFSFFKKERESIVYHDDIDAFRKKFPQWRLSLEESVNFDVESFTADFKNINVKVADIKYKDTEDVGIKIELRYNKKSEHQANEIKNWLKETYKSRIESFKEAWKEELDRRDFEARR